MCIYVRFTERKQSYKAGPKGLVTARLEQASGGRCLVVPYQEMSIPVVRELAPRAITVSGFGSHFHTRKIEWFFGVEEVLREASVSMICFCGSHQLLALASRLWKRRQSRAGPGRPCDAWARCPSHDRCRFHTRSERPRDGCPSGEV